MAKSNNGTAIQFYATNHSGDSILDKNNFGGGKTIKYTIDNGDLIIQQDCANVKGTYWTTKFGFRHWKLPGLRNRGVSMYDSGRPMLIGDEDENEQLDDDKDFVLRRPRLILDTSLSTRHADMVRKFVKEARAGETPFDFFTESELSGDGEGQHDDDENVKNDDFGAIGGDGFGFNDDVLAFSDEKSEEEEQRRPTKRKALGDRSNTANQAQCKLKLCKVYYSLSFVFIYLTLILLPINQYPSKRQSRLEINLGPRLLERSANHLIILSIRSHPQTVVVAARNVHERPSNSSSRHLVAMRMEDVKIRNTLVLLKEWVVGRKRKRDGALYPIVEGCLSYLGRSCPVNGRHLY